MTVNFAYGGGRWYDTGGLTGKRGMVSVTTGGPPDRDAPDGLNGDIGRLLWPVQNGILRFCGFTVPPPFVAWAVARVGDEARALYLEEFRQRVLTLDTTEPLFFHPLSDFDDDWRLKVGVVARTGFQWNP